LAAALVADKSVMSALAPAIRVIFRGRPGLRCKTNLNKLSGISWGNEKEGGEILMGAQVLVATWSMCDCGHVCPHVGAHRELERVILQTKLLYP
jgi:hypothetical protein